MPLTAAQAAARLAAFPNNIHGPRFDCFLRPGEPMGSLTPFCNFPHPMVMLLIWLSPLHKAEPKIPSIEAIALKSETTRPWLLATETASP